MKKPLSILLSCILLLSLTACGQKEAPAPEGPAESEVPSVRTVTDSFAREVTIPAEVKTFF